MATVCSAMGAILNVVLPVFAIMAAGYLCGRAGILGQDSSRALNGFVYYAALPALFFGSLADTPLALMTTYPALALLGRLSLATGLGAIAGAVAFAGVARVAWRFSISRYTSASS